MKKSTIMLLVSVLAYAMGSHAAPPPANQVLTDALRCGAGNATGDKQLHQQPWQRLNVGA